MSRLNIEQRSAIITAPAVLNRAVFLVLPFLTFGAQTSLRKPD